MYHWFIYHQCIIKNILPFYIHTHIAYKQNIFKESWGYEIKHLQVVAPLVQLSFQPYFGPLNGIIQLYLHHFKVLTPHSHEGSWGLLQDTCFFYSRHVRHSYHCTGADCSLRKLGEFHINYPENHEYYIVSCCVYCTGLSTLLWFLYEYLLLCHSLKHFALNRHC